MAKENTVKIIWCIEDIQTLQPSWSDERCAKWLDRNESELIDRSVSHGWEVIEEIMHQDYGISYNNEER